MGSLLDLIKTLFGPKAISSTLGTRTNVVRFPGGKLDRYLRESLNIEAASDNAALNVYRDMEQLVPYVSKMNDSERLIFEGNLGRLRNKLEAADLLPKQKVVKEGEVVGMESKEKITGEELKKLIEEQGTKYPPTTELGKLETAGKKLTKMAEEMSPEFLAKQEAERQAMIARQYEGKGYAGGVFGPSGMYRAVARNFLLDEAAKGKIKLSPDTIKNLQERNYISGGQPLMYADPIRIMRYHYGDDVFEKIPLDKIPTGAPSEIRDVMSKVEATPIKTEAPKTPGGYLTPGEYKANIEELQRIEDAIKRRESRFADMTEEEIQNELQQYGSKRSAFEMALEQDYPEEYAKYKGPKEPEKKAEGGAMGLDYLTGMEPPKGGYATGGRIGFESGTVPRFVKFLIEKLSTEKLIDRALLEKASPKAVQDLYISKYGKLPSAEEIKEMVNKELQGKSSMETVNSKTGEVTTPKEPVTTAEKPIKEFTDDEMISYIKKYKEEGPTLEEFTKRVNEETGSNFTPEQLAHAYRVKVAYPHSTPIVDSQGKFIGGGLYNPPLDVSVSDRETLTKSIMQTKKSKSLDVPKKTGEGKFTKQEVLEKIIQNTIDANPTDEYVQKNFPNFLKEIKANPELSKNENVWKTFTQDFPDNKRLVVYGDDTVDFFTKGENLPEGMKQTQELANTYGLSMEEAMRIKQMEPEDQVMEIKKLQILKKRTENAKGGRIGYSDGSGDAPSITLDSHEKAPGNMDKYPIKAGNLELGISGLITGGKNYQPDPYNKITGSEKNLSVRGKYNVPDTGVSLTGDIGDIRSRSTQNINMPEFNYKEKIRDVFRMNPYSVGIEYAPDQNRNINLRYDNQGNVSLRGEYKFAKGGLGYLMGE